MGLVEFGDNQTVGIHRPTPEILRRKSGRFSSTMSSLKRGGRFLSSKNVYVTDLILPWPGSGRFEGSYIIPCIIWYAALHWTSSVRILARTEPEFSLNRAKIKPHTRNACRKSLSWLEMPQRTHKSTIGHTAIPRTVCANLLSDYGGTPFSGGMSLVMQCLNESKLDLIPELNAPNLEPGERNGEGRTPPNLTTSSASDNFQSLNSDKWRASAAINPKSWTRLITLTACNPSQESKFSTLFLLCSHFSWALYTQY